MITENEIKEECYVDTGNHSADEIETTRKKIEWMINKAFRISEKFDEFLKFGYRNDWRRWNPYTYADYLEEFGYLRIDTDCIEVNRNEGQQEVCMIIAIPDTSSGAERGEMDYLTIPLRWFTICDTEIHRELLELQQKVTK
ncbi:MAG: hypothetical protein GY757_10045 [bacterium]|nr:hypothetical protein [bacterium]